MRLSRYVQNTLGQFESKQKLHIWKSEHWRKGGMVQQKYAKMLDTPCPLNEIFRSKWPEMTATSAASYAARIA